MATPRSVNGFETAISEVEEKIEAIDQELQEAEAGSTEEEDLLANKAEQSVELETLKQKFVEYNEREAEKAKEEEEEEDKSEAKEEEEEEAPEVEPKKAEAKWPETMYVAARSDVGFMVNPFNHVRITTDYKKVVVDGWVIDQVKAGLLIVDKD